MWSDFSPASGRNTVLGLVLIITVCLLSISVCSTTAQVWRQVSALGPQARDEHAVAYDSARDRVVLFGGYNGSVRLGDTWEWAGSTQSWTQLTPATAPSPRSSHAMAYDSSREKSVLFGGSEAGITGTIYGDTWEWDGSIWTQVSTTGPPIRFGHAMAYDNGRGKVVLFGGVNSSSGFLGDIWEWDGNNWTNPSPLASPTGRSKPSMAYDSARDKTIMFGGLNYSGYLGDTWEWDGSAQVWTQLTPATSPIQRSNHATAYDSGRGKVILCGGYFGGAYLGDTWELGVTSWTKITTSGPIGHYNSAITFDSTRGKIILFGGNSGLSHLGDTWEYAGNSRLITDHSDYNGDVSADITIFRPSTGKWFIRNQTSFTFGQLGDIPVPGDYDGDGSADAAIFRPAQGRWRIRGLSNIIHGNERDIPVPGDYDSDGDTDMAVFRSRTWDGKCRWFVYTQSPIVHGLESKGDIPVPGDYDGDGDADIAIFRRDTWDGKCRWFVRGQKTIPYGTSAFGDVPVPADYDGDGDTDIAVCRVANGNMKWFVYGKKYIVYGIEGDIPVPGDYNGDGAVDFAVFRPSNGKWFVRNQFSVSFGTDGDIPLVRGR